MWKKSGFTIVEQAIVFVPEFEKIYRDKAIKKPATLDGAEFLHRFCQHILPQRFVKIRRFGICNHTARQNPGLRFAPEEKPGIVKKATPPPETNHHPKEQLS